MTTLPEPARAWAPADRLIQVPRIVWRSQGDRLHRREGRDENVSFVGPGSGFLVLDKNLDGRVNNGSELFGPGTGNGFKELAQYDADGNGWIDEDDPIYSRLSVWKKGADGKEALTPLSENNVGAVNLSPIASQFDQQGKDNRSDGQVSTTGIYVDADGNVKTIQQVDLTV